MSSELNSSVNQKLGLTMPVQVIRTRRKRTIQMSIEVDTVLISMPGYLTDHQIETEVIKYKPRLENLIKEYQLKAKDEEQICLFDSETKIIKSIYGFPVEINRSSRIRFGISIDSEKVLVKVSTNTSQKRINEFIRENYRWIKNKLKKRIEFIPPKSKEFRSGSKLCYLGKEYTLEIKKSQLNEIKLTPTKIIVFLQDDLSNTAKKSMLGKLLFNWYHLQALKTLKAKVLKYEKIIGVQHKSLKLGDYKTKWGHCTNYNELAFNWRLILAPEVAIDYVVIHELCHILEHNHSAKFWQHVQTYMPDYKKQDQWLNKNSNKVFITNNIF